MSKSAASKMIVLIHNDESSMIMSKLVMNNQINSMNDINNTTSTIKTIARIGQSAASLSASAFRAVSAAPTKGPANAELICTYTYVYI